MSVEILAPRDGALQHGGGVSGFATGGPDTMTGITSVTGSAAGQNSFRAGAGNETFAQPGPGVGDRIDFSAVATSSSSPLTINVSGAMVNGLANDSASVTPSLYSFATGGAAFTSFSGAASGNTDFLASGLGGYRYIGQGTPNTLNLSAAPAGTVVTVNGNSVAQPGSVTKLTAGTGGATSDAFADVQFFVGHVSIVSPVKAQPSKLPHASVGAAYMQQLTGVGGTAPYTYWSVESGSLPPGLVLSPSGLLSGAPTVRGTFTFVVTLVDAHNVPGATTLTLVVNPHMKP
jgi:large repetitive protein